MPQHPALPDDIDLAWSDADLDDALRALLAGDVDPAVDFLAGVAGDPDRRELAASVLGSAGRHQLALLRDLVRRRAADADAHLLLGSALNAAAWTARGAAVMSMTSEEQVASLRRLNREARTVLHGAVRLAPGDPVPFTVLQQCALAVCERDGECGHLYDRAVALAPELFNAHHVRLTSLTRKWYGSQEQMLAFARERTRDLPDGHPLLSLVALAHIEGHVDGLVRGHLLGRMWRAFRYVRTGEVRAEVDAAADRLLRDDARADHPWMRQAHQLFACFYHQATEPDRARPHLERGGPRPSVWPWGYFGDGHEDFFRARKEAGLQDG